MLSPLSKAIWSISTVFLWLGSVRADVPDLLTTLSGQSTLTKFTSYLKNYTDLVSAASSGAMTGRLIQTFELTHEEILMTIIPVLAPSDAAWDAFYQSTFAGNYSSSPDELEALLSYHIVKGARSQYSISSTPQFWTTLLTNSSYTNVTTGQVVTAILNGSASVFDTAVNQVSTINGPPYDIVFEGGIIHIINEVLVWVPQST